jgi:hypothetical protein
MIDYGACPAEAGRECNREGGTSGVHLIANYRTYSM